jgi:hypothetical protein
LQLFVQLPHCSTLSDVFVSQPVLPGAQWLNPVEQLHRHAPAWHEGVPLVATHGLSHPPQFSTFESTSLHCPAQHVGLPPLHVFVHVPQLKTSLLVSTQRPPQHV